MLFRSLISLSIVMFGTALAAIDAVPASDKTETTINVESSPKSEELQAAATGLYAGASLAKYPDGYGQAADYGGEQKSDAFVPSASYGYGHNSGGYGHGGGYKHHSYHGPPAFTPHAGHYGSKGHYSYEDKYHSSGKGYGHGDGGDGGDGYGHGKSVYGQISYSHDTYEFSCHGKHPSFYGDAGHECRVFHICQKDGRQDTFKCPKWTRFNNYLGICDWHFKIDHSCNPITKKGYGGHGGY